MAETNKILDNLKKSDVASDATTRVIGGAPIAAGYVRTQGDSRVVLEIFSTHFEVRSGTKNGNPWSMRNQSGDLHLPNKRNPVDFEVTLSNDGPPMAVGIYEMSGDSFMVGKFNRLELGRISWVLVKA